MPPDFSVLSSSEFETLAADLIGRELGLRFEQFGEGPDGGMDGRHVAVADRVTILQAKRYGNISDLNRAMRTERDKIDRLDPARYILATSVSMTPARKTALMEICGPSLGRPSDIYGQEDLAALLRKYPEIEEAHQPLWAPPSGGALERIIGRALEKHGRDRQPPQILKDLLPPSDRDTGDVEQLPRDTLFLLGVRPVHDPFLLWLGPKLEAHGYRVFCEIMTLEPGDRWRKEITVALERRAAKVLVALGPETRRDDGVMDRIEQAKAVAADLGVSRHIIPLRLKDGARIDGLHDAVPCDFSQGWAEGLSKLLDTLGRQGVPRRDGKTEVAPQWDSFRKRGAVPLVPKPELLVSNWIWIDELPDEVHFYEASGAVESDALSRRVRKLPYPAVPHGRGLITFADPPDVAEGLEGVAKLRLRASASIVDAPEDGMPEIGLKGRDLSNMITDLLQKAWDHHCRQTGMVGYEYSGKSGFHASPEQAPIGAKIPWGRQGERRSSMLRNRARKHIWSYGVTAIPRNWPFWHFRLKARVLFAEDNGTEEGKAIEDSRKMHRLRRSGCKGWRNKQWRGRLLAFLQIMSGDSAFIRIPLAPGRDMLLASDPILFTSPVSTSLPDTADPDAEEEDITTLGRPEAEEDDDTEFEGEMA